MKMFLTRIGFGSKAVVTGDVTQIDLHHGQKSGLVDALQVLHEVRGIAFSRFTSSDVVRHPMVGRIVDAYDNPNVANDLHQFSVRFGLPDAAFTKVNQTGGNDEGMFFIGKDIDGFGRFEVLDAIERVDAVSDLLMKISGQTAKIHSVLYNDN